MYTYFHIPNVHWTVMMLALYRFWCLAESKRNLCNGGYKCVCVFNVNVWFKNIVYGYSNINIVCYFTSNVVLLFSTVGCHSPCGNGYSLLYRDSMLTPCYSPFCARCEKAYRTKLLLWIVSNHCNLFVIIVDPPCFLQCGWVWGHQLYFPSHSQRP